MASCVSLPSYRIKHIYIYLFIFKYVEIETRYLLLTSGEKNLSDYIFILECLNLPNRNISSRQVFN